MDVVEIIKNVKSRAAQWGQLIAHETYSAADVARIIKYYEDGTADERANDTIITQAEVIDEQKQKIAQLHGQVGGLKRTLNKATKALDEHQNVKANNERLARISSYAADFVAEAAGDEDIEAYPTFIRLSAELD